MSSAAGRSPSSLGEHAVTDAAPAPPRPVTSIAQGRLVAPLSAQLYASAQRFLDIALRAYGRGDKDVFALHAGVAIEHLMKARLAAINPMLILDVDRKPSVEAMLWLADVSKHDQRPPESLRTLSGERATELLSKRIGLAQYAEALTKLRQQRNGIGHFGSADLESVAEHLPMILAAAVHVAEGLTDNPQELFGVHREFAAAQLREWDLAEERDLAGRIAEAQRVLEEKHPHLTAEVRAVMTRAINDALDDRRWTGIQVTSCPVCKFPAAMEGDLSLDFDVSYGPDGEISGGAIGVFDPTSLGCSTCDLVLGSAGLVKRSGAMEGFEVPWEDVRALEDYESGQSWRAWEAAGFPGRDEGEREW